MAVSRQYVDHAGKRCATRAERDRSNREHAQREDDERHAARVRSTIDAENGRAFAQREIALSNNRRVVEESGLTGTARALALEPINRADVALHTPGHGAYAFSGVPGGETRAFVGLMPENHPQRPSPEAGVVTNFSRLVEHHRQTTGCDLGTAIKHVQTVRPDLALQHGQEVNAAVDRHAAERSAKWTQHDERQLSNMVEARMAKTGESFGDALAEISRSNLQMFERRRLALSQPINLR